MLPLRLTWYLIENTCCGPFLPFYLFIKGVLNADILWQNNKGQGRLKYLLQQTELFSHFAKGEQSTAQKKTKGRYD